MSSLENFLRLPLKNSFTFEVGVSVDQAKLVEQAQAILTGAESGGSGESEVVLAGALGRAGVAVLMEPWPRLNAGYLCSAATLASAQWDSVRLLETAMWTAPKPMASTQRQSNFNVLPKDEFLYHADFAQCIGPNSFLIVIRKSFHTGCILTVWMACQT